MLPKTEKRNRRHKRVRAKAFGVKDKPRLCVFRSNRHTYAQLINDENGKIMAVTSDLKVKNKKGTKKTDVAKEIGKLIAEKAKSLKVEEVVFDRGGYKYHGRIKSLADGAREGGLKF